MLEKLEINLQHAFPIFSLQNVRKVIGFPPEQTEIKSNIDFPTFKSHENKLKNGNKAISLASSIAFVSAFDSFKRISGEFARSQACSSLAVNASTYCVGIFDYKRDNWLDSITEKMPLHPLLKYYV